MPGVLQMPALEDTAGFVRKIIDSARRTGADLGVVMPGREFFSAAVIPGLDAAGVKYVIPCKNTDTVVATINWHDDGKGKRREVESVISRDALSARYATVITKRRKKRSGRTGAEKLPAHERLIGFATNVPGIDPDEYGRRRRGRDRIPDDKERKGQDTQQGPGRKDAVLCVLGRGLQRVGHGKRDDEGHDGDYSNG